jgi:hypothetical protein
MDRFEAKLYAVLRLVILLFAIVAFIVSISMMCGIVFGFRELAEKGPTVDWDVVPSSTMLSKLQVATLQPTIIQQR